MTGVHIRSTNASGPVDWVDTIADFEVFDRLPVRVRERIRGAVCPFAASDLLREAQDFVFELAPEVQFMSREDRNGVMESMMLEVLAISEEEQLSANPWAYPELPPVRPNTRSPSSVRRAAIRATCSPPRRTSGRTGY